jgi:hypothetical protein
MTSYSLSVVGGVLLDKEISMMTQWLSISDVGVPKKNQDPKTEMENTKILDYGYMFW